MMRFVIAAAFAVGLGASLGGCGQPTPDAPPTEEAAPAAPAAKQVPPVTDAWIGEWIGVEGNTLKIEAGAAPGHYKITEGTLDGPTVYTGTANGEVIARDGSTEIIRSGTGAESGLKYLADKNNCLVIESGRGFCR